MTALPTTFAGRSPGSERQAAAPRREPCPLSAWPPGERAYILCREDRAISPAWSRRAARERLGVEPIELDGSHSPFISRPAALAAVLDRLARVSPRATAAATARC